MTHLMSRRDGAIFSTLNKVDWDFPRAGTWANDLHSLHWFPGNFIPQIPSYLVQSLSQEGDMVFDPFCGSCTTGVEAVILGRSACLGDVSPVSHLISRAKLTLLTDEIAKADLASMELPPLLLDCSVTPPEKSVNELRQWFHPDTLEQLYRLWTFIAQRPTDRIREILEMLFSDTLFACASTLRSPTKSGKLRRHHWGWVADNVVPKPPVWHDAVKYFEERLHRAKLITARLPTYNSRFYVRQEDVRLCSYNSDSVDLAITSPPYLGMIDYTTANRLTYLWYGWDIVSDRISEIGARSRRNSPSAAGKYLSEIDIAVSQIFRVLKPGAFCTIVIGSSRKYPAMALKVVDAFAKQMALFWGPQERTSIRRRVSDRKGSSPSEYICVLRKE
jgi:hypothetical protein